MRSRSQEVRRCPITRLASFLLLLVASVLVAGCSGGGSGSGASGEAITESLNQLGIDTTETPRLDDDSKPLPGDYSPLGLTRRVDPLMEVYLGGVSLAGRTSVAALIEDVSRNPPVAGGTIDPEVLFELEEPDAPWWLEDLPDEAFPETLRAVVAGDLDGDGIDEIVTVFFDDPELSVQIVERGASGLESSETPILFNSPGITNVALACGDFDADARDDLAVGYSIGSRGFLLHLLRDENSELRIEPNTSTTFEPNLVDGSMELILEAGNLDHDDPLELVVLINERAGSLSSSFLTSRYHVLDDRSAGYTELTWSFVEGFETGVGLHVASVADLALGDIDGDPRDEILFGGLESLSQNCEETPHVFIAVDDATTSFHPMGAKRIDVSFDGCADGPTPYHLRFVHVNVLDIDGDGLGEVQTNQFVFEDWKSADPWTQVADYTLPSREILDEDDQEWFDRTNSAMTTGDVTGDGREDILLYRDGNGEVRVFGLPEGGTQIEELGHVVTAGAPHFLNPALLVVNVDKDTKVVRATGVREHVWIEPIVVAVLAAPPCQVGIGQNTDVCQTTFGNTDSSGTELERSASISVDRMFGVYFQSGVGNTDFTLTGKLNTTVTGIRSFAYSVEKTINFTTGPNEDTVVFTTVPVDLYQYQILQHPDPTFLGQRMDVALPREPVYLQVERGFYNEHAPAGSLVIDDSILAHAIGDVSSYPSRSEKDAILAQYGGLEIGPQSVGQGAGQTELELVVGEEWGDGGSLEIGFEINCETTLAGWKFGLTIGGSVENKMMLTSGQSTTYSGVVGSIDAAHFMENQYEFGLFTYPVFDGTSGQEFEVINYWVE